MRVEHVDAQVAQQSRESPDCGRVDASPADEVGGNSLGLQRIKDWTAVVEACHVHLEPRGREARQQFEQQRFGPSHAQMVD